MPFQRPTLPYANVALPNANRYSDLTNIGNRPPTAKMLDADIDYLVDTTNVLEGLINGLEVGVIPGAELPENAGLLPTTNGFGNISWIKIGNGQLLDGSVNQRILSVTSVGTAQLINACVTVDKLADESITGGKLALQTINGVNIAHQTITHLQISNGTILGTNIAPQTISDAHIIVSSITGAKIANNTITNDNIAPQTITGAKIVNATITGTKLINETITALQIANGTITTEKIIDLGITAAKIANSTITATQMADGAITTSKIANNAVEVSKANVIYFRANCTGGVVTIEYQKNITSITRTGNGTYVVVVTNPSNRNIVMTFSNGIQAGNVTTCSATRTAQGTFSTFHSYFVSVGAGFASVDPIYFSGVGYYVP